MLVPCNWTVQSLRKPKWDGNFRQNHYEWAYVFEKLIDSNLLFIAVGRPNSDQCFGKSTLKSKSASTVKTGLLCIFWRCTLIVKQPNTIWQLCFVSSTVRPLVPLQRDQCNVKVSFLCRLVFLHQRIVLRATR